MTTLTKIEVRIVQFMILCGFILVSKRWFSWLLKVPVFTLLVCGFIITRPYDWIYTRLCKRHYGKNLSLLDIAHKLLDMSYTERFVDIVDIFM